MRQTSVLLAVAAVFMLVGCQTSAPEGETAAESQETTKAAPESPAEIASKESGSEATPIEEAGKEHWDSLYMEGSKVGHSHTMIVPLVENDDTLQLTTNETSLTLKRFGQTISQQITLKIVETENGKLVRFETQMSAGGVVASNSIGRLVDGNLNIETETAGLTQSNSIPWQDGWGGFFAVDKSLLDNPLKPGETRKVQALMPMFHQMGDILLKADDYETTSLPWGEQKLLKIESITNIGKSKIESSLWMSESGEIIKTFYAGMNQTTYRCSKQAALREETEGSFDLGEASIVRVKRQLKDPHATEQIVYRVRLAQGNVAEVFSSGSSQSVKPISKSEAEITVTAIRPGQATERIAGSPPANEDDLSANNSIQTGDPRIVKMAGEIAPQETDPWQIALALEKGVHERITGKNFSQAFATAAQVAKSLEGDCTEHSVLLAALCRVRKIPARVCTGLVYFQGGYAYHMWNEVWIDDRWIAIDATLGRGGIGGAHLKLSQSNLKGADAYKVFLPVFQVIGVLELEIVDVK